MKPKKMSKNARLVLWATVLSAGLLTVTGVSAQPTTDPAKPDPLQIARGAKAWAENCERCHNIRDPKEFSDKNWDVNVLHMRTLAPLPGALARDIEAFLKASN